MFKRNVQPLKDLLLQVLREQGLETPLNEHRAIAAWAEGWDVGPEIAGPVVARYTLNTYIYNQTLHVRLSAPALRSELSMQKQELIRKLNAAVGEQLITDIRFA